MNLVSLRINLTTKRVKKRRKHMQKCPRPIRYIDRWTTKRLQSDIRKSIWKVITKRLRSNKISRLFITFVGNLFWYSIALHNYRWKCSECHIDIWDDNRIRSNMCVVYKHQRISRLVWFPNAARDESDRIQLTICSVCESMRSNARHKNTYTHTHTQWKREGKRKKIIIATERIVWLRFPPLLLWLDRLVQCAISFSQSVSVSFGTYRDCYEKTIKLIFAGKVFAFCICSQMVETSTSSRKQRKIN